MAEPRITLTQVAERAGVSKTTAGYVLTGQDQEMRISEETRHKVLRAAAGMNCRPNLMAPSLRTIVSRPVAIISDTLVTEPYGGELIGGCPAAAAHHRRLTFIGETRRDPNLEAALVEEFLRSRSPISCSRRCFHARLLCHSSCSEHGSSSATFATRGVGLGSHSGAGRRIEARPLPDAGERIHAGASD